MKKAMRIFVFVLLLASLMMVAATALANSKTGKPDFGESVSFFVKTNNDGKTSHTVKATFEKGKMFVSGTYLQSMKCYNSYEAIVYYKNKSGNYQWESQYTCYNTSSKTLTLKKANTDYKVVIRAKDAKVVWDSYVKNGVIKPSASVKELVKKGNYILWEVLPPQVKLSTVSGGGTGNISK